jgi:23S rRNA (adenine1618-N6)-methyltransferase
MNLRNKHRTRYDLNALSITYPELQEFIRPNNYGDDSIDFFDPAAVKALNKSLILHYYGIKNWDIPINFISPAIPDRADYVHHLADILYSKDEKRIETKNNKITCLDIGVGANCIYPIIGAAEYGWNFIGSDIDTNAIKSAKDIVEANEVLNGKVQIRLQKDPTIIFEGILKENEKVDVVICNPPFHTSFSDAKAVTAKKLKNLDSEIIDKAIKNFGGKSTELWCHGGEVKFIHDMIYQSQNYADSVLRFSTLVNKQANVPQAELSLKKFGALEVQVKAIGQGNKRSRIISWTFQNKKKQQEWAEARW